MTNRDAVILGMNSDRSSGPVGERVNDLKALRRGVFGRALCLFRANGSC